MHIHATLARDYGTKTAEMYITLPALSSLSAIYELTRFFVLTSH